ncbi:MAG: outer membrane beta-barrel protein [Candidatus Aminicenantes bacterium]|nr:MAG: outer membrane beta-barrel protein [Candidatus Aminicenantes bacterium]
MSRYLKITAMVLLLVVLTSSGFAQLRRLGFFINAAGYFPTQKNINAGYGSGIGGVFYLNPEISVSLEWKYSRFSVDKEQGKFLDGRLTVTPLVASVHYNISMSETFSPYVFAGGGLFFSSFRLDERVDLEEENVRRQEIKNGLGFYGGIGSMIKLNTRLSLFFEGLYLRRIADAETIYFDNSPATTFRVNLSSFSVLVGLDYFY